MDDNLKSLTGIAEVFDSHTSPEFIQRLVSMYMRQEPACIVVRSLAVDKEVRPDDLKIENTYPDRAGEQYSKEVARLLSEELGGHEVKTGFGNVIREVDPMRFEYIQVEPTHTHPDVKINDMFCLISDGALSNVTFVDEIWGKASDKERAAFEKYDMIHVEEERVLWNPELVDNHDIFEKLESVSESSDTELAETAKALAKAIRENAREYYLREGDFIFFAQLKTLRGAPAYEVPASGIEKRWYQSMTYA